MIRSSDLLNWPKFCWWNSIIVIFNLISPMKKSPCIYYMTLDPDACMYDAGMNDAYIMVLDPDAHINDAGLFRYRQTNKRTKKVILGDGFFFINIDQPT